MGRGVDRCDDRGSVGSELVVMTVVFAAFVAMVIFAGRVNVGYSHAEAAARAAARTISIDRNPASAVDQGRSTAADIVKVGSAMCESMSFQHSFEHGPEGELTDVTVEITCQVDLSEAGLLFVPGSMRVDGSATESIDQYRESEP
jgi:hypothetical protein